MIKKAKKPKQTKEWHVANTKYGMGDHYGTGVKNPIGKPIEIMKVKPVGSKKTGKPPKSLA